MQISWRVSKLVVLFALSNASVLIAAEPADEFSRANCFNNESITYNYWDPPTQRGVISHHVDTDSGYAEHFKGSTDPVQCASGPPCPTTCTTADACLWPVKWDTRHAAIHNFADGVPLPGISDRWSVHGVHVFVLWWEMYPYPSPVSIKTYTGPVDDCNLHFDQFY